MKAGVSGCLFFSEWLTHRKFAPEKLECIMFILWRYVVISIFYSSFTTIAIALIASRFRLAAHRDQVYCQMQLSSTA